MLFVISLVSQNDESYSYTGQYVVGLYNLLSVDQRQLGKGWGQQLSDNSEMSHVQQLCGRGQGRTVNYDWLVLPQ